MQPARYLVLSLLTFWALCGMALSRGHRSKNQRQNILGPRDGHGKGHTPSHGFGQGHKRGHGHSNSQGHGHGNGQGHGFGQGHRHGHGHGNSKGHGHSNRFGQGHRHGHEHGNGQGHGHDHGFSEDHRYGQTSSQAPEITVLKTTVASVPVAASTAVSDISDPDTAVSSTTSAVASKISTSGSIVGSSAAPTSTVVPRIPTSKTTSSSSAAPTSTVVPKTSTSKTTVSSSASPSSTDVPGSTSCRCGVANRRREKVASGEPAKKNEFPWLVSVVEPGASVARCSATLLNSVYAITKQFGCGEDGGEVIIDKHLTTEGDEQMRITIECVIYCPHATNCVLLKLGTPIVFPRDNAVAPICLPLPEETDSVGTRAIVVSWRHNGRSDAPLHRAPRKLSVTVAPSANCQANFQWFSASKYERCVSSESKKGSAYGDEGSPLMHAGKDGTYSIIGVLTLGNYIDSSGSEIYTRVTPHLAWLKKQIADGESCAKP